MTAAWLARHERHALAGLLALLAMTRIPTLFEPWWFIDEGIYGAIARALLHGRVLYVGIWDNKPPGIYLLYALLLHFFGSGLWSIRVVLAAAVVLSGVLLYALARRWLTAPWALLALAFFILLTADPWLGSNAANAEFFVLPCSLFGLWAYARSTDFPPRQAERWLLLAGAGFGAGLFFKMTAAFDLALPLLLLTFTAARPLGLPRLRAGVWLVAGILLVSLPWWLWLALQGALGAAWNAVILGGLGYVSLSDQFSGGWGLLSSRLLPRAVATALALAAVLGAWRGRREGLRLWASLWLALVLFSITMTGRSHDHYLIQLFPVACLLAAAGAERLAAAARKYERRPAIAIASGVAMIGLALSPTVYATVFIDHVQQWVVEGHWDGLPWELQPVAYYQNWLSLVTGKMSRSAYDSSFDRWTNVEDMAALADYLDRNTPPGTPIYQWGYAPQLYVLADRPPAGRYVAETLYYVSSQAPAQMITDLQNHPPVLFAVLARLDRFPQLRDWVGNEYAFDRMVGHLEVYRLGDTLPSVARDDLKKGF